VALHLHAGKPCKHPTKAACEAERRAARVRCEGLLQEERGNREPRQCVRLVDPPERYCSQHFVAAETERRETAKETARREDLDRRIADYMAWTADHPSVWDRRPSL